METLSPALLFWESRPLGRKLHNAFQRIATTLADLNAEGLNVQTVNDLLTMYVGAASQHVLRMSFVPEQEAQNFDRQVLTFWSRLMHRDITSKLFFSTPQAWWFWSGICCSTTCGCSMACVAVGHPFIDDYNPNSGHRFTFSFNTTATCPTHPTSIHHLPTNEQTLLPTQTTRSCSTPPNHPKETSLHHSKKHPQAIFTTTSPTHLQNKPSSCHNPLHTLVRTSCSRAVKHMRLRIAASTSQ